MQRCPPAFPAGKKQSGPSLSEILHHPVCRTLPLAQGLGGISRLSWCIKLDAFIGESFPKAFILCRGCRSSGHPGGSDGHGVMENYPCIPPLESGHVPAPGTLPVTLAGAEEEDHHPHPKLQPLESFPWQCLEFALLTLSPARTRAAESLPGLSLCLLGTN